MNKLIKFKKIACLVALTSVFVMLGAQNSAKAVFFWSDDANILRDAYNLAMKEPTEANWLRVIGLSEEASINWSSLQSRLMYSADVLQAFVKASAYREFHYWREVKEKSDAESTMWGSYGEQYNALKVIADVLKVNAEANAAIATAKLNQTPHDWIVAANLSEKAAFAWGTCNHEKNKNEAIKDARDARERAAKIADDSAHKPPTLDSWQSASKLFEFASDFRKELGDEEGAKEAKKKACDACQSAADVALDTARQSLTLSDWMAAANLSSKAAETWAALGNCDPSLKEKGDRNWGKAKLDAIDAWGQAINAICFQATQARTQKEYSRAVNVMELKAEACKKFGDDAQEYYSRTQAAIFKAQYLCNSMALEDKLENWKTAADYCEKAADAFKKSRDKENESKYYDCANTLVRIWGTAAEMAEDIAKRSPSQKNWSAAKELYNKESLSWKKIGDQDNAAKAEANAKRVQAKITKAATGISAAQTMVPATAAATAPVAAATPVAPDAPKAQSQTQLKAQEADSLRAKAAPAVTPAAPAAPAVAPVISATPKAQPQAQPDAPQAQPQAQEAAEDAVAQESSERDTLSSCGIECLKLNVSSITSPPAGCADSYLNGKTISYRSPEVVLGEPKLESGGYVSKLNEYMLRNDPDEYSKHFYQDKNGYCYVSGGPDGGDDHNLHCAGRFYIPSLGDLKKAAASALPASQEGKIVMVYSNNCNRLLDVHNIADCGQFELFNPPSNQNAIETQRRTDYNKTLGDYSGDESQGPRFMKKCPWTSLFLLHVLNGSKPPVKENSPLFRFNSDPDAGQYELNLLADYGATTSAGYPNPTDINGKKRTFMDKENDNKFRCVVVENAHVVLRGGEPKVVGNKEVPGSNPDYYYDGNGPKIDLFIDASLPYNYLNDKYEEEKYDEEIVKEHLKRHYHALFSLCKATHKKRVCVSMIGTGVFGVKKQWHIDVLKELTDEMKESGTTYIFNAYFDPTYDINDYESAGIQLKDMSGMTSWNDLWRQI